MKARPAGRPDKPKRACWRDDRVRALDTPFSAQPGITDDDATMVIPRSLATTQIMVLLLNLPTSAVLAYLTSFLSIMTLAFGGMTPYSRAGFASPRTRLDLDKVDEPLHRSARPQRRRARSWRCGRKTTKPPPSP